MKNLPDYKWDEKAGRYRLRGSFVRARDVQRAVDKYLQNAQSSAADTLFEQLQQGRLNVKDAQLLGEKMIARAHLNASIAAKGGRAQMAPADYGRVGGRVKSELGYWRDLMREISQGKPLDGRVKQSFRNYVAASAPSFQIVEGEEIAKRGFDQWRNKLNDGARHCEAHGDRPSCAQVTRRGWVAIGERVMRGARGCYWHCQCEDEYRNSVTGEVRQ